MDMLPKTDVSLAKKVSFYFPITANCIPTIYAHFHRNVRVFINREIMKLVCADYMTVPHMMLMALY